MNISSLYSVHPNQPGCCRVVATNVALSNQSTMTISLAIRHYLPPARNARGRDAARFFDHDIRPMLELHCARCQRHPDDVFLIFTLVEVPSLLPHKMRILSSPGISRLRQYLVMLSAKETLRRCYQKKKQFFIAQLSQILETLKRELFLIRSQNKVQ